MDRLDIHIQIYAEGEKLVWGTFPNKNFSSHFLGQKLKAWYAETY